MVEEEQLMIDPNLMLVKVCEDIVSSQDKLENKLAKFMAIFKLLLENGYVDGENIMKLAEKEIKRLYKTSKTPP
jgi:hypothetical protein